MKNDDEALRRDLQQAYGRDLPGEEFDARVMQAVADGGGEHEITVAPPAPRRALAVGGLLAACLLVLVGYGLGGGFARVTDAPGEGEGDWDALAGGRRVRLPVASQAQAFPRPIRITITSEGEVFAGGGRKSLEELSAWLRAETQGTWRCGRSERPVVLRADRRVRWREVQWVMQACAHPDVGLYRLHFQALPEEGAEARAVLPALLPRDRGLTRSDMPFREHVSIAVRLRRRQFRDRTEVKLLASVLGDDEECFRELARRVKQIVRSDPTLPGEIDASADVPHQDVVRVLDIFLANGVESVTFVGAPPPKREPSGLDEREDGK